MKTFNQLVTTLFQECTKFILVFLIVLSILLFQSCKKDDNAQTDNQFKNEELNLNDNQVPGGWELSVTNPEVKLADGRLIAYPTDAFGFLRRKGIVANDVIGIKFEWDGNLTTTTWGMYNMLQINYSYNKNFAVYLQTASVWSTTNNFLFLQYNYNTNNSLELGKWTVPLQYGEFHYTVTLSDDSIVFVCKETSTQHEYINRVITIPSDIGFSLQLVDSYDLIAYTTTDNINWLDNISISILK